MPVLLRTGAGPGSSGPPQKRLLAQTLQNPRWVTPHVEEKALSHRWQPLPHEAACPQRGHQRPPGMK